MLPSGSLTEQQFTCRQIRAWGKKDGPPGRTTPGRPVKGPLISIQLSKNPIQLQTTTTADARTAVPPAVESGCRSASSSDAPAGAA